MKFKTLSPFVLLVLTIIIQTVEAEPAAPKASIYNPPTSTINLTVGQSQIFQVECTDPDGDLRQVNWYWEPYKGEAMSKGWEVISSPNSSSAIKNHTRVFSSTGTYFVEAMCLDKTSQTSEIVGWKIIVTSENLIFQDDFRGPLTWTASGSSVYIKDNEYLYLGSNGRNDDFAEKTFSIDLSDNYNIVIEQRLKLESKGLNYRLPWQNIVFEDGSKLEFTYLPSNGGRYGWSFGGWTGNDNNAVPGSGYWTSATAGYWAVTKAVISPNGGELYVKPDDAAKGWFSTDFSRVATKDWKHSKITKISFIQPWDSVNYIDYIKITKSKPTVITIPPPTQPPIQPETRPAEFIPAPIITSIDYPNSVSSDRTVTVTITVKNNGVYSPEAYVSPSFSNDWEIIDHSTGGKLYRAGSKIWDKDSNQINSKYTIVEWMLTWDAGETKSFWVKIKPKTVGDLWFNVRVAFLKTAGDYQRVFRDPGTDASFTDQQGYYVYKKSISVSAIPELQDG